jgi:hypothetical protein
MTKYMMVIVALFAMGLMIVACGGTTTSTGGEEVVLTAEEAPAEEAPAEEAPAEEAPAEGEAAEGEAAEGDAAAGGPCEAYAACCNAYAEALGGVASIPAAAVDATKESCAAIESLKALPTAGDACQQSYDGLKAGMEAYKAMPGFDVPAACQ